MFNFNELKVGVKGVEEWLQNELSVIRTGRASPAILDFVQVESYGSRMAVKELANIVVEDAKTVRIEPWDISVGKEIEKAINNSNLGLSLAPFEKGLRVIFPDLTSERREQFVKVVKGKLEEARVRLRGLRDKTIKSIDEKEKSEDTRFRLKEEMQKIIDEAGKKFEALSEKKEGEIRL